MGGASILFRTDDYARSAVTGNTEGAPSPAEWKHLGNFTEKAEGSARHQTPKLKSTEWWWQCSRVWVCLGFTSTLQDSYSIAKLDFLYTCGRKSSDWHWDQNHGQSGTLFSKANLYWHIGIFQFQTPFRRSFNTTDGSLISLGTSLKPLSATPSIHIYKSNSTASCNYLSFQRCTNYRNIHS